jgi:hypothetical protein
MVRFANILRASRDHVGVIWFLIQDLRWVDVMLVKFKSEVGGFTMFGDVAKTLLKMMGHSGTIPSAILPEDIPSAILKLETALESASPATAEASDSDRDRDEEPVALSQRAYPLLELLKNAAQNDCSILWDRA